MSHEEDRVQGLQTSTVRAVREATGLHERLALPIARQIVAGLLHEFGGESFYFPKRGRSIEDALLEEFDGLNREQLCRKYNLPRRTFYRMIERARCSAAEEHGKGPARC